MLGSSASQMTAAKVMFVIARLPDCARQAPTQYPLTTKLRWRMLQDCSDFRGPNVQIYGSVFHDTNGPNHGQSLTIQWFLLNRICTDTHLLASCGKDSSKKFNWDVDGQKYRVGNVCLFIDNKDRSFRYT